MKIVFVVLTLFLVFGAQAQTSTRYIVQFKNKATTPFSLAAPAQYLSQRAINRRNKYSIAIDSTDLPVTPRYIDSIRLAGNVTVLNVSKWLNRVSILTTDAAALAKISGFSFVQSTAPITARTGGGGRYGSKAILPQNSSLLPNQKIFNPAADYYDYGLSYGQIHIHNGEFLHNIGLRGQGMIVGIFDAGFFNYTSLKAFDSVNQNGQVLGVHDFVAKDNSVTEDNAHGMQCFSVMAANITGQFVGSAPKAGFYLFRSEDAGSEYPIEEHNWVCAAERADSAGADVVSSSLGYNTFDNPSFNHNYSQLNGNTTIAAIGADLAAKKGILVINSAGNEGNNSWGKIATPADGDSVLAVAAVSVDGVPASFTSRGPTSDGQVKPDVASVGVGTVIQGAADNIGTGNGTSFSCPNMAGLATCLWQGFPEFNNINIIQTLRQAGDRFATPNDTTGYGIPDMRKAVLILLKKFSTATAASSGDCKFNINWTSKDAAGMKYELERKSPGESSFTKIGEVQATGVAFSSQTYTYTDSPTTVQAGTITYRIRQIIDSSTAATTGADYIDTITVDLAATCTTTPVSNLPAANEEFLLLPNPSFNNVNLRIKTPYAIPNLTIRLVDGKGAVVATKRTTKPSGTTTVEIDVSHLPKGTYYLTVFNNEQRLATKELVKL